ncbi:MAG: hypothetical protein HFJ41_04415 [Clostridia bacterium]|nr:hypothetical protein [Clostridia bacterium]
MIKVRSNTLSQTDLVGKRNRVTLLKEAGYSNMAILYFMAQKNSVSGVEEDGNFVITLS